MRSIHRILSVFVVIFLLYLAVTGTIIQVIDMNTLFRRAPATDPSMMAIREGFNGPDDFEVITTHDYAAPVLPHAFDYQEGLAKLESSASAGLGDKPWDYAELRMTQAGPAGFIQSGKELLRLDLTSNQAQVSPAPPHERDTAPSLRNTLKSWHRMTALGSDWVMWINPLIGISLSVFIVTGLVVYCRLLIARRRLRRKNPFWNAGGLWRSVHRWVSLCAAAFLVVVALSGLWLAVESLGLAFYFAANRAHPAAAQAERERPVVPLDRSTLSTLLATGLAAERKAAPDQPIKIVRVRNYGGMTQAIVVAGEGDNTRQTAFNAVTGHGVSESEPGYPNKGMVFGWDAHQIAKSVHRGDYIGVSGRWMDLFSGLALLYLSISGIVMYVQMWARRRKAGRANLLWM